jgi:hypothetical protein
MPVAHIENISRFQQNIPLTHNHIEQDLRLLRDIEEPSSLRRRRSRRKKIASAVEPLTQAERYHARGCETKRRMKQWKEFESKLKSQSITPPPWKKLCRTLQLNDKPNPKWKKLRRNN